MDTVKVAPDNFDQLFFMRAVPRKEFTQTAMREADKPQKMTRDGQPLWSFQLSGIDWRGGMQSLTVTIPMYDNPAESFQPGQPVELVNLVFGVTPKQNGGYVTWCSADDLRAAAKAAPLKTATAS